MPKKTVANYHGEAETMLVRVEVIKNALEADIDIFAARFSFVNTEYIEAITNSLAAANALPLDSDVVSDIRVLTANVNAKVLEGRIALSDLNTYATLAYKNQKAMLQAFGQKNWPAAANDQEKMRNALESAALKTGKAPYAAVLDAKGFKAADTTKLITIATAIGDRNILQEDAKSDRPVTTEQRITQYNNLWDTIKDVSLMAKMLFRNNAAKYHQYLLYPNNTDTTTVDVTVNQTGTTQPLIGATVKIIDSPLVAQTTNGSGIATFSSVNIEEFINLEITSEDGTITIVENLSVTPGTTNNFTVEADT